MRAADVKTEVFSHWSQSFSLTSPESEEVKWERGLSKLVNSVFPISLRLRSCTFGIRVSHKHKRICSCSICVNLFAHTPSRFVWTLWNSIKSIQFHIIQNISTWFHNNPSIKIPSKPIWFHLKSSQSICFQSWQNLAIVDKVGKIENI